MDSQTPAEIPLRLARLPYVPLRLIVSYLPFDDAVTFCGMHPAWSHLQPTIQNLVGDSFQEYGPHDGNFVPLTYFDINVVTSGISSVAMQWQWKDQGFGNKKGQIWLRLMRNGREIADAR